MELAPTDELFENPQNSYTKKLLAAAPIADPKKAREAMTKSVIQESIHLASEAEWREIAPNHFVRLDK